MSNKILAPESIGSSTSINEITSTTKDSKAGLDVNVITDQGSLLQGLSFDYIAVTYPTSTQEVYTYKSGGSGGTTVATITVNYVDSTKEQVSNVART